MTQISVRTPALPRAITQSLVQLLYLTLNLRCVDDECFQIGSGYKAPDLKIYG